MPFDACIMASGKWHARHQHVAAASPTSRMCCSGISSNSALRKVIEGFSQYKDLAQVREVAEKACETSVEFKRFRDVSLVH